MCFVKENYPKQKFEDSFFELWAGVWEEQLNLSDPAQFQSVLERHFTKDEATAIAQAGSEKQWKDQVLKNTEEAIRFAVGEGLDVMYVTEDTTRADPATLRKL